MINFIRHIERLLLSNNCVIIPELGSFVTHYIPAKLLPEDGFMLPPTRIVAFNHQLRINDECLTNELMESCGMSYRDAASYISRSVWQIKKVLKESGTFIVGSIGTLYVDANGVCKLRPNETGIPTPSLFALDCVTTSDFITREVSHTTPSSNAPLKMASSIGDRYVFSINREIANYVAAAMIAIVCLFAWQGGNSDNWSAEQRASVISAELTNFGDASKQKDIPVSEGSGNNTTDSVVSNAPTPALENGYTVVLASDVSEKNAIHFIEQLKGIGIPNAEVYTYKGRTKVICGRYATEREAAQAAAQIRTFSLAKDCWVFKL